MIYLDFSNSEVVEILFDAIYWQDFLDKGFSSDYFGTLGYASCIAIRRINLPDPAGITIRGCTYENLVMEIAEIEFFQVIRGGGHSFSVDEKRGCLNG